MPYTVKHEGGKYCVHKADEKGNPIGESFGCHESTEEAGAQIGAIEHSEQQKAAFDDSPWDGSAGQWDTAEAYCSDCLIDENPTGQKKIKDKCSLPYRKSGSSSVNRNALKIMASGHGLPAVQASAESKRKAAQRIATWWKQAFKKEAPPSITKFLGRSKAYFKQDKSGNWWLIGFYTNKFKDRQDEILSDDAHRKFVSWVNEKSIHLPVTVNHMPKYESKVWVTLFKAFEEGRLSSENLNKILNRFYAKFALGTTERVFYSNGFVGVIAKIFPGRIKAVQALKELDFDLGMSHGFIPFKVSDNIINEYRTFEASILPNLRAANTWNGEPKFLQGVNVDEQTKELLNTIEPGLAGEVEQETKSKEETLTEQGVEYRELPDLVEQVVKALGMKEFAELVASEITKVRQEFKALETQVQEQKTQLKKSKDELLSQEYSMGNIFKGLLVTPTESKENIVAQEEVKPEPVGWNDEAIKQFTFGGKR
jgi:hypothetical protein